MAHRNPFDLTSKSKISAERDSCKSLISSHGEWIRNDKPSAKCFGDIGCYGEKVFRNHQLVGDELSHVLRRERDVLPEPGTRFAFTLLVQDVFLPATKHLFHGDQQRFRVSS